MTKSAIHLCCFGMLALAALEATPAASLESPGCLAGGEAAVVAHVGPDLDLELADGRVIHIPGLAMRDGAAAARLGAWLQQGTVLVHPLRSEPDRWGRIVALVFADDPTQAGSHVSVTEALLDAGLVAANPDPLLKPCWARFLALESLARQEHRGLWAQHRPIDPVDLASVQAAAGTVALVEGTVADVHAGRARLYVRFASRAPRGFAVALSMPMARQLAKAGNEPRQWVGHVLRARGFVDNRWGWQIDVSAPEQLELDPR